MIRTANSPDCWLPRALCRVLGLRVSKPCLRLGDSTRTVVLQLNGAFAAASIVSRSNSIVSGMTIPWPFL